MVATNSISRASSPISSILNTHAGALIEKMVIESGIELGSEMVVHDQSIWGDWAARGMLAIGETYMRGKWDAPQVDVVMGKLATLPSEKKRTLFKSWRNKTILLLNSLVNPQRPSRELQVAEGHYNLGNDFFRAWLDPHMQYSCAYWKQAENLLEAQQAKLRILAEKLQLKPGMRVLDIGCGWGGLGRFLVKEYGVKVTGVNISTEQLKCCCEMADKDNLGDSIELVEQSYRDLKGQWDRIIVVGMLEHVGPKNYKEFFDTCSRCLTDDGFLLIQTIGSNMSQDVLSDRWITTYIFPNGTLPSIAQIAKAVEKKLVIEDLQNLGPDYDKTLMAWHENFQKAKPKLKMSRTLERMWDFYLLYTASGFRERKTQLWQIVMSKKSRDRYDGPR